MKKMKVLCFLFAVLLLFSAVQPAVFAEDAETQAPLRTGLLKVVPNENGFGTHLETEDGTRYAVAYPKEGLSGRSKAPQNFPERYDSRDLGLVTPVKDQGFSGICWAFSVISCLETNAAKKGLADPTTVDYSESHLAWFAINSKTTDKNDSTYGDGEKANFNQIYQTGGNSAYAISSIARGSGLANESDFSFENDFKNLKVYKETDRYVSELHMSDSSRLDCFENEDRATLMADTKRAIMEYGSVSASFYASAGNELYVNTTVNGHETTAYYQNKTSDPDVADHMVTIVGWDDNFSVDNFNAKKRPSKPGAWIIKNSWGIGSGIGQINMPDGYLYISYEDPSLCEIVSYEAMDKNAYDRMYQYDGYFYAGSYPADAEESAAYANVFTAKEDSYLSKVGLYTVEGNQKVDVVIYRNLGDLNNPESGEPVSAASCDFPYEGYHTVDLPALVALKGGETFSVVIQAAAGTSLNIPVEANYLGVNNYACNPGESFIYLRDSSRTGWNPASALSNRSLLITENYTICNVPVKAMAVSASRHTHHWSDETYSLSANCVRDGGTVRICDSCTAYDYVERTPATGHTDANGDGYCDICDAELNAPDACPYCQQVHTGFFGGIVAFFHRIFYFFKNMFRR